LKVRRLLSWILLATATGILPATAQDATAPDAPQADVVQEFSGGGTTTTGFFKVQDHWEVRWNARQVVSVAVMSADGTIVAGAAGVLRGSLFVPLGGQYYLKVSDGTVPPPPPTPIIIPEPLAGTNAAPVPSTNAPAVNGTNAPPVAITNAAPAVMTNSPSAAPPSPDAGTTSAPPVEPIPSWHLQVVQLGPTVSAGQALTVYTPYFMMPDTAVTPVPAPPPPPVLTEDEAQTVVTIKGDNAQGSGFLMRSSEGTFVVTHLHLLAANPNLKLFTSSGAQINIVSLKGAVDRDLALFTVQDNNFTYLPLIDDSATKVEAGDQLIIPDIGEQSDILLGKPGRVIGMNAERIDFDTGMGPGSTGAPVIHVKSGTALALVTAEKQVDVTERLAQAWAANPAPGSASIIPYFGLRLDGVQGWENYDPARFLQETLFLQQFHADTRALDSYLNGRPRRAQFGNTGDDNGPPDNRYYLTNPKLHSAIDSYRQLANGADENQHIEAARELLSDVEGIADTDLSTLQAMKNLYAYDQTRAREELAYRQALKKELDEMSNNIVRFDNIARTR